ncbi:tRNA(Met) cytidine acetyltransferase TmcA [Vibrio sp. F74]|uniref:tRNA(Met) cytidine acetyltransferase TmcA n=1 Tax=Vibrio sp. F74 TaxID=700020 RepID=UPI0035F57A70
MTSPLSYLKSLSAVAETNGHRYLVRLKGDDCWQDELLERYLSSRSSDLCYKLGGKALVGAKLLSAKQGAQLLGREVECLIYDDNDGFDANSFTAASGALCYGGILFLLLSNRDGCMSGQWLEAALVDSITVFEHKKPPALPIPSNPSALESQFYEQENAISLIKKVISGHRKRPLILTADRGRGKSSALGIAAAQLINSKDVRIVVTAPSRKAVDPVFVHAKQHLTTITNESKNSLSSNQSFIQFISPDELIRSNIECDLVLVDEASAIPVSMLLRITSLYHRAVFSSTIHGYEGCGRGFTLKFFKWLDENRPGWKKCHIEQPIRWNKGDPLEAWVFDTFLLNTEVYPKSAERFIGQTQSSIISKEQLLSSPTLFKKIFSLLVSAHYQTSPNDMMQILDDESIFLFVRMSRGDVVGCIVAKVEGELSPELIQSVMKGIRRPKGHLAPVILAGQMGFSQAAICRSLRVMRIAVAQEFQHSGIGSQMLCDLRSQKEIQFDYLSTSFGVTSELYRFWLSNRFYPVRLGSSLDHASGTYSLLMLSSDAETNWLREVEGRFCQDFIALLPETFQQLSASFVLVLLRSCNMRSTSVSLSQVNLVQFYVEGGSGYESVVYPLSKLLLKYIDTKEIHPILVSKLLQKKSWNEIATIYSFSGRKQSEQLFRQSAAILL